MKKILIIIVLPILLLLQACSSFVDGFDISPNNPTEVTNSLLLSTSQLATFTIYGGQLARLSSVLTQHSAGTDFQFVNIANYVILEGDNNNEWENIYTKAIINENKLIAQAGDENPYYRGMARVLKAMALGVGTDMWGNIPNREAAKAEEGSEFFNAAYDDQETIIADIQELLSLAIEDLSKATSANSQFPGADDYIFGGDVAAWINAAWILKARYAMRISKKDSEASTKVLNFLGNATLAGTQDDANAVYGVNGNELNQWNAFLNSRGGYMMMGEFYVNLLKDISDPRLPFFVATDLNGEYRGTPLGSVDNSTSTVGSYFASPTSPAPLVTFVEAKFLEAEANFRLGNLEAAATAHNEAITASVEQVTGESIPADYQTAQASETSTSISLEKIMTHKYVALFTQIESYSDWRRTGIPTLTPNPTGTVSAIPRRLPTPQVERINNTKAVVTSNILEPVWWDQ